MNYKTFFTVLFILVVITTLCITAIKPSLHKSVLVYNSDYKIVSDNVVEIEDKTLPTVVQVPKEVKKVEQKENKVEKIQQTTPSVQQKRTEVKQIKQNNQVKQVTKTPKIQEEVKSVKTKTASVPKAEEEIKKVEVKPKETITAEVPQTKVLTQQQEEIEWNKWRSRLQNQIMSDVNLPIVPKGTVFKFSFNVDKYGRVSEVQTWSTTPAYTPYAIQYIAPVIRSYQGHSILNFPNGSKRITTQVNGGWKISVNEKLSTPQDYNDVERVTGK